MALNIGGFEEAGIIDHTFVMHQTGVIKAADHLCHLEQGLTAKRFVAQRPDQNSRMIFVTLVSGIHAVKQDSFPLRLIIGQNALDAANTSSRCTVGMAYSHTLRKMPEKRKKS